MAEVYAWSASRSCTFFNPNYADESREIWGKTGKSLKRFRGLNQSNLSQLDSMGGLHPLCPQPRGVSGDLVHPFSSPLPPPGPSSPPPPLGCMPLCSPSTSSNPSLLRFHFNRWSFSSFHRALWENTVKENKTASSEMYGWGLFQMAAFQQCLVIISDSGFAANSKTTEVNGSISVSVFAFYCFLRKGDPFFGILTTASSKSDYWHSFTVLTQLVWLNLIVGDQMHIIIWLIPNLRWPSFFIQQLCFGLVDICVPEGLA